MHYISISEHRIFTISIILSLVPEKTGEEKKNEMNRILGHLCAHIG